MADDVREKARKILEAELPAGARYASNDGKKYEQLTGYSHAALTADWDAGLLTTACMGYVAHYCGRMGITPNLGRFDVDKFLPKIHKDDAWVRSTPDERPKYGDILLHMGTPHIDVAMGFDGKVLIRGAAGQGIVGKADVVARVRGGGPYNPANLKGWVDIELYLGAGASATTTNVWLKGWWRVSDAQTYFYCFGDEGYIEYTRTD